MSVIVIGSLIIDNTIYVQKLPERGETTFAKSSLISYGGKGANQALAAHLAGSKVNLIGSVGSDSEGDLDGLRFEDLRSHAKGRKDLPMALQNGESRAYTPKEGEEP